MNRHRICAIIVAASLAAPLSLAGDPLIDNLLEPIRDRTDIALGMPLPMVDIWAAQSFISDAEYALDLIQVILSEATEGCVAVAELRVGATGPDTTLTTLSFSHLPSGPDDFVTLTPDAPVTLVAGEVYWLVMGQIADPGNFKFAYADTNVWNGPGAFANYFYSFDQAATWIDFGADFPYQLRVEVSPVPPPPACYPDCDGDLALSIDDFICFQTFFALGDPYADCDVDGVLSIDDFICFQTYFAIGC